MPKGPASLKRAGAALGRRFDVGERRPTEDDLAYCKRRIFEEEVLANAAGSWEAGLVHDQMAMLYRAQLPTLMRLHKEQNIDVSVAA